MEVPQNDHQNEIDQILQQDDQNPEHQEHVVNPNERVNGPGGNDDGDADVYTSPIEGVHNIDIYEAYINTINDTAWWNSGNMKAVINALKDLIAKMKEPLKEGTGSVDETNKETYDVDLLYDKLLMSCDHYIRTNLQKTGKDNKAGARVHLVRTIRSRAGMERALLRGSYMMAHIVARQKERNISEYIWSDIFLLLKMYKKEEAPKKEVSATVKEMDNNLAGMEKLAIDANIPAVLKIIDESKKIRATLVSNFPKRSADVETEKTKLKTLYINTIKLGKEWMGTFQPDNLKDGQGAADAKRIESGKTVRAWMEKHILYLENQFLDIDKRVNDAFEVLKTEKRLRESHTWSEVINGEIKAQKSGLDAEKSEKFSTIKEYKDKMDETGYAAKVESVQLDKELVASITQKTTALLAFLDKEADFKNEPFAVQIREGEKAYKETMDEAKRFLDNHGEMGRSDDETKYRAFLQGLYDLCKAQSENLKQKALQFRMNKNIKAEEPEPPAVQVQQPEQPVIKYTWHEVAHDVKTAKLVNGAIEGEIFVSDDDFESDYTFQEEKDMPIFGSNDKPVIDTRLVKQGGVNDCYLISVLVGLAEKNPMFVYNMIRDNGNGTATVRLYAGEDAVYVTVRKSLPYGEKASLASKGVFWIYLVEKAASRILERVTTTAGNVTRRVEDPKAERKQLTFSSLHYGTEQLAYQILTGKTAVNVSTTVQEEQEDQKANKGWDTIKNALSTGQLVTCSTDEAFPGILTKHVYYVAGIADDKIDNEDTLTLFNPYGAGSTGIKYIIKTGETQRTATDDTTDNGLFSMKKSDFMRAFPLKEIFILDPRTLKSDPIGEEEEKDENGAPKAAKKPPVPTLSLKTNSKAREKDQGTANYLSVHDNDFENGEMVLDRTDVPVFGPTLNPRLILFSIARKDSYILSTLAALAESKPGFVRNMVKDNYDGTATVRLFTNYDQPVLVNVDKTLPKDLKYEKLAETGLWAYLIEKAATRILNTVKNKAEVIKNPEFQRTMNMTSLDNGTPQLAYMILTGKKEAELEKLSTAEVLESGEEGEKDPWKALLKAIERKDPITCISGSEVVKGISSGITYIVTGKGENIKGEESVMLFHPGGPGSLCPIYKEEKEEAVSGSTDSGSFSMKKTDYLKAFGKSTFIMDNKDLKPTAIIPRSERDNKDYKPSPEAPPEITNEVPQAEPERALNAETKLETFDTFQVETGYDYVDSFRYLLRFIDDNAAKRDKLSGKPINGDEMKEVISQVNTLVSELSRPVPNLADPETRKLKPMVLKKAKDYFPKLYQNVMDVCDVYLSNHKVQIKDVSKNRKQIVQKIRDKCEEGVAYFEQATELTLSRLEDAGNLADTHIWGEMAASGIPAVMEGDKNTKASTKRSRALTKIRRVMSEDITKRYQNYYRELDLPDLSEDQKNNPLVKEEYDNCDAVCTRLGTLLDLLIDDAIPAMPAYSPTDKELARGRKKLQQKVSELNNEYTGLSDSITQYLQVTQPVLVDEEKTGKELTNDLSGIYTRRLLMEELLLYVDKEKDATNTVNAEDGNTCGPAFDNAWNIFVREHKLSQQHSMVYFLSVGMTERAPAADEVVNENEEPQIEKVDYGTLKVSDEGRPQDELSYVFIYNTFITALTENASTAKDPYVKDIVDQLHIFTDLLNHPFEVNGAAPYLQYTDDQLTFALIDGKTATETYLSIMSAKKKLTPDEKTTLDTVKRLNNQFSLELQIVQGAAEIAQKKAKAEQNPVTIRSLAGVMVHGENKEQTEVKKKAEKEVVNEKGIVSNFRVLSAYLLSKKDVGYNDNISMVLLEIRVAVEGLAAKLNEKLPIELGDVEAKESDLLTTVIDLDGKISMYSRLLRGQKELRERSEKLQALQKDLTQYMLLLSGHSGKKAFQTLEAANRLEENHTVAYMLSGVSKKDIAFAPGSEEQAQTLYGGSRKKGEDKQLEERVEIQTELEKNPVASQKHVVYAFMTGQVYKGMRKMMPKVKEGPNQAIGEATQAVLDMDFDTPEDAMEARRILYLSSTGQKVENKSDKEIKDNYLRPIAEKLADRLLETYQTLKDAELDVDKDFFEQKDIIASAFRLINRVYLLNLSYMVQNEKKGHARGLFSLLKDRDKGLTVERMIPFLRAKANYCVDRLNLMMDSYYSSDSVPNLLAQREELQKKLRHEMVQEENMKPEEKNLLEMAEKMQKVEQSSETLQIETIRLRQIDRKIKALLEKKNKKK